MIMRISMPNRFRLKKVMGFRTMIRPERGEIHYIGGADILPAPLSLKEETEALNKFGTEEEKEAKAELIEHNLRLVVYIAKKFDNTSVGVEDLISIGTIGLIKAINTFNPTKNIKLAINVTLPVGTALHVAGTQQVTTLTARAGAERLHVRRDERFGDRDGGRR